MPEQLDLKRIAKLLTVHGYRNSNIENIHAGKRLPKKYLTGYSRITQAEMKELNKQVCNQIYTMLYMLTTGKLNWYFLSPSWTEKWDEPQLVKGWFYENKQREKTQSEKGKTSL